MASLESTITIKTAEYRPCYVNDKKALFHRWAEKENLIIKYSAYMHSVYEERTKMLREYLHSGLLPNNCTTEKVTVVLAIVEYEDGTVAEVEPTQIRFADTQGKMRGIAYE